MFILVVLAIAVSGEARGPALPAELHATMTFSLESCEEAGRKAVLSLFSAGLYAQFSCFGAADMTIH